MNVIYLVKIIDQADFNKTKEQRAFKSSNAAHKWGVQRRDEYARAALSRGEDIINYEYSLRFIDFVGY